MLLVVLSFPELHIGIGCAKIRITPSKMREIEKNNYKEVHDLAIIEIAVRACDLI